MARTPHLARRDGIFYWRRRIPSRIVDRLGSYEIRLSLGTRDRDRAQRLAHSLASAFEDLFVELGRVPDLTKEEARSLARRWLKAMLEEMEQILASSPPRPADELAQRIEFTTRKQAQYQGALARGDLAVASDLADAVLRRNGIECVDRASPEYQLLCQNLLRGTVEYGRMAEARLRGDYTARPADPLFADLEREMPAPALNLSAVIERHMASAGRDGTAQTRSQCQCTFHLFQQTVGDVPIDAVTRAQVSTFIETIARLPNKWGQWPRYRDKTLNEMLALADDEAADTPRLSRRTLNRHVAAVSGLFKWAAQNGLTTAASPASGYIKKKQHGAPIRRPWRIDELHRLFDSPPWAGAKSAAHRLKPGTVIIRDACFFIPLIGLYSGMRLNEICQLHAEDVRSHPDFTIIDIVRQTKTHGSRRSVPVHPELVRLGFIRHVDGCRAKGGGPLWPELSVGGIDKTRGHNFGKWFGRAAEAASLIDPGTVFHSFRKNMATALHTAGLPDSTTADILGHSHQTMSYALYSAGPALRTLYEAVCKVDYGLDLSRLHVVTADGRLPSE